MNLIAHKPYSTHPDDAYLTVVLYHNPNNTSTPYVTWINNLDSGFSSGHYFSYLHDAILDFNKRGAVYEDAPEDPLREALGKFLEAIDEGDLDYDDLGQHLTALRRAYEK